MNRCYLFSGRSEKKVGISRPMERVSEVKKYREKLYKSPFLLTFEKKDSDWGFNINFLVNIHHTEAFFLFYPVPTSCICLSVKTLIFPLNCFHALSLSHFKIQQF